MKMNPNHIQQIFKTVHLAVFVAAAMICFSCNPSLPKGELSISPDPVLMNADAELASHKAYDVVVDKTQLPMGKAYGVKFYQNENGILNYHFGFWGSEEEFDKAAYSWVNDTIVSIRLYHSQSKKEAKFKVTGYGTTNGIRTDD